jgi:hypothetical protein
MNAAFKTLVIAACTALVITVSPIADGEDTPQSREHTWCC